MSCEEFRYNFVISVTKVSIVIWNLQPQMQQCRKPGRQTTLRDIELGDFYAKPRCLQFLIEGMPRKDAGCFAVHDDNDFLRLEFPGCLNLDRCPFYLTLVLNAKPVVDHRENPSSTPCNIAWFEP